MAKLTFFLDGAWAPAGAKILDIFTPGRHPFFGVFETMLLWRGKIDDLEEHTARLLKGLKVLRIKHPWTRKELQAIVHRVAGKNPALRKGRLRLMVFREGGVAHCACLCQPYKPYGKRAYREGLPAVVLRTNRLASSRFAQVKSLDYAVFTAAQDQARAAGAQEAILLNARGHVMEASRGNIFIHDGNAWLTPPLSSGCLAGITRQRMMRRARQLGAKVREKNITLSLLKRAKRVVMTGSLTGVIPLKLS